MPVMDMGSGLSYDTSTGTYSRGGVQASQLQDLMSKEKENVFSSLGLDRSDPSSIWNQNAQGTDTTGGGQATYGMNPLQFATEGTAARLAPGLQQQGIGVQGLAPTVGPYGWTPQQTMMLPGGGQINMGLFLDRLNRSGDVTQAMQGLFQEMQQESGGQLQARNLAGAAGISAPTAGMQGPQGRAVSTLQPGQTPGQPSVPQPFTGGGGIQPQPFTGAAGNNPNFFYGLGGGEGFGGGGFSQWQGLEQGGGLPGFGGFNPAFSGGFNPGMASLGGLGGGNVPSMLNNLDRIRRQRRPLFGGGGFSGMNRRGSQGGASSLFFPRFY